LPPRLSSSTGNVAGALDRVRRLQAGEHLRQVFGLVGAVRVVFDEDVVAGGQSPAEAGDVGGSEPFLAGAVQHMDVAVGGGEIVGEPAGAVG